MHITWLEVPDQTCKQNKTNRSNTLVPNRVSSYLEVIKSKYVAFIQPMSSNSLSTSCLRLVSHVCMILFIDSAVFVIETYLATPDKVCRTKGMRVEHALHTMHFRISLRIGSFLRPPPTKR